ncbi:MAG: hypothetical protein ACP5UO_06135, partial [Thermoplasmata archaeon]
ATFRTGTTLKLKNGSSAKRSQTVRNDGVTGSKSGTSVALARRVCQALLEKSRALQYGSQYWSFFQGPWMPLEK